MGIIYPAATKETNLGSKPVEPKTELCHKKFPIISKFLRTIRTETHNPKQIYFALETQNQSW